MSRYAVGFIIVLLCLASSRPAVAAIPGADNPNSFTERQYRARLEQFNRKTILEAYKQIGRRDPKWDAAVLSLLEKICPYMAYGNGPVQYRQANIATSAELEAIGRPALAAGCDDPIFLDMFSITLLDQGKLNEVIPLQRKAAMAMAESKYAPFRIGNSIRRARRNIDPKLDADTYRKFDDMLFSADLQALAYRDFVSNEPRFVLEMLDDDIVGWTLERQASFHEQLGKTDANPWLKHMIGGIVGIKAAWAERGTGYADKVTEAGWRGMGDHLTKAHAHLLEAHRLHPDWPEAATNMITVVMGGVAGPGESLRGWFDNAVAGQFDYSPAYRTYIHAIYPRWHGSHELMYQFGLECMQTARHDTSVPMQLITVLTEIQEDAQGSWSFWRRPGVIETARDVLLATAEKTVTPDHRQYILSELAGFGWQVGEYGIAKDAIDRMDGKYSPTGFDFAQVIPSRTWSGIHAMSAATGRKLIDSEQAVSTAGFDQAIQAYSTAANDAKPDDPAWTWLHGRRQELIWQKQFEAGETVNLMDGSPQLHGWYSSNGKFRSEGDAIVASPETLRDASLILGPKFGTRWEWSGVIQAIPRTPETRIPPSAFGGYLIGWNRATRYYGNRFYFGAGRFVFHFDENPDTTHVWEMASRNVRFTVRWWDGSCELVLNEKTWLPYRKLWPLAARPDNRIGLTVANAPDVTIKFSGMKIRKLTTEPVAAK